MKIHRVAGAGGMTAGMILFALFSHRSFPEGLIGAAGIVVAGASIIWSGFGQDTPARTLGLDSFRRKAQYACLLGAALGLLVGLLHRRSLGLPAQSNQSAESFVLVACAIGMTEELIYRGWLYGTIRRFGWPVAVAATALAHGAYKTALFMWPGVPAAVDLPTILLGTIVGGLALGLLRASTGSLAPAMIAHATFDFVVYQAVKAPWWVWQ